MGWQQHIRPSNTATFMACPAMPKHSGDRKGDSSEFAEWGTAAHAAAAHCLEHGLNMSDFTPEVLIAATEEQLVTLETLDDMTAWPDDMAEAVMKAVDYCRSQMRDGDVIEIERRVSALTVPDAGITIDGTADFFRYRPETKHLLVADHKFGAGVPVEVVSKDKLNAQLMTYCMGIWRYVTGTLGHEVSAITLVVIQPRCFHAAGPIRSVDLTPAHMADFAMTLHGAIMATTADQPTFGTNAGCRWCPGAEDCPALAAEAETVTATPPEGTTDPAELLKMHETCERLNQWVKSASAHIYKMAANGVLPEGMKLVEGRKGNRSWPKDTGGLEAALLDGKFSKKDTTETKLRSPAALEKVAATFGKVKKERLLEIVAEHVTQSTGAPTLVPLSDKRPSIDGADDLAKLEIAVSDGQSAPAG